MLKALYICIYTPATEESLYRFAFFIFSLSKINSPPPLSRYLCVKEIRKIIFFSFLSLLYFVEFLFFLFYPTRRYSVIFYLNTLICDVSIVPYIFFFFFGYTTTRTIPSNIHPSCHLCMAYLCVYI